LTAGEYLVANSTLPSGTALQHLLALQIGTGTGSGQTIFCSQFNVRLDQQELVVTRRAKRRVQAAPVEAAPRKVPTAKDRNPLTAAASTNEISVRRREIAVSVLHSVPVMTVFDQGADEMTIQQRTASLTVTHKP